MTVIIYLIILLVILIYLVINKKQINWFRSLFIHIKNNFIPVPYKKRKILIITAENRDYDFIKYHDTNFNKYTNLHGYTYQRMDNCHKSESSTYWCKIHKVKEALDSGNYDYVMWADSDTVIVNNEKSIDSFISEYGEPDIISSIETIPKFLPFQSLCAGVFLIKNGSIGKNFIDDCLLHIKRNNDECIIDNTEQGIWAGICYEQGVMNLLLKTKYKNNVYISDKNFIYNTGINSLDYTNKFIIHLYGTPNDIRSDEFKKFI